MTLETIATEIALAEHEFTRLNSGRSIKVYLRLKHTWITRYRQKTAQTEARVSELAERLARLYRFRSMLFAREYALDRHDWRGPEDFAIDNTAHNDY